MRVELVIVIIILSFITFFVIESFALHFMMKSKMVYIHEKRFIIGVLFAFLAYLVAFFLRNREGLIWPVVVFSGISFFNLFMYNLPRVSYNDSEIDVLSFMYKRKKFSYEDISGIKWGKNGDYVLYLRDFKLYVDETAIGNIEFLRQVFQRREEQLHQRIPEMKDKLFHGYFVNARELLIAYMLVPAFLTVCFFAILLKGEIGKYPENMNAISMQFDTCIAEKEELLLSNNTISLKTRKCDADTAVSIMGAVEQKKTLTINYVKSSESLKRKEGVDGIIWSLSDGPELLISTEETLSVSDASAIQILWILGILAFIGWILFFAICYVLNNAPRYKKLVKILVKKENWRF